MKRRNFLKSTMASAWLTATTGITFSASALAASTSNRHIVFIQAAGGWDVTNMWDPKGSEVKTSKGPMNKYSKSDIRKKGNIRYAPIPAGIDSNDWLDTFTKRYYRDMLVINGVDQETNSHSIGNRVCLKGTDEVSNPTTAAMLAALNATTQPMAFIGECAHNSTGGLVPASKLGTTTAYRMLGTDENSDYLGAEVSDEIKKEKLRLLDDLLSGSQTTNRTRSIQEQLNARMSTKGIEEFLDLLPTSLSSQRRLREPEIIAAALAGGVATSAQYQIGGFDSHSDNDQRQFDNMDELLESVDYLIKQLEQQNVLSKTTIVMVSDMARSPGYNTDDGKDHWPVTSMVLLGAGISGNRVIGGTDDNLEALTVDKNTWSQRILDAWHRWVESLLTC